MTDTPPALVIGGDLVGVAAARSLGRAGVEVHAVGHPDDATAHCRYVRRFTAVDAGPATQDAYFDWLARGPGRGVIVPCNDDALELIARRRADLEGLGYVAAESDDSVLAALLDKARTSELCERHGIPAPTAITLEGTAAIERACEELAFPCALKPLHSHLFAERAGPNVKLVMVETPDELRREHARLDALGVETLATELVPGPPDAYSSYYSYIDAHGEPLFHFTKRKLRQWPIDRGYGTYHVTDWNPDAAALGLRFLEDVGVRGLACVEFKRDERDAQLKLIECNHRLTAATELVSRAGLDLPLLQYERALCRPGPELSSYTRGLHLWHPIEDVRALREYRAVGELTTAAWARSLLARQRFPLLSLADPKPSLARNSWMLRRLASKLGRKVSRPEAASPSHR
jgi:D-aspartate ligase